MVTSRGCPGKCTFCDKSTFGNKWRGYSAEYLVRMIKHLIKEYGIKELIFYDDTFILSRQRLINLCEILIREKLDFGWSCQARINRVDIDTLKLMKQSGCWQIAYGIESGSQEILDFLQKGITLKQIKDVIRWTKNTGIIPREFFMIGLPLETEDTMRQTINFAKILDLEDFHVTIFTPLPGSKIYEEINQYGTFNEDWRKMNMWSAVFIPNGLTRDIVEKYHKRMFREFYIRPKIILSHLKRIRKWEK